jgi:hypothetical protein
MRKFLISAAIAASTIAVASPASAQYHPQQQGNAYGHNNNYGQARSLIARVDQIRRQIDRLDNRDRLSNREADRLRSEARMVRNQVRSASFNGLNYRERQALEYRVARLEQRVRIQANDGNRFSANAGRYDRDRDGRDDRYEDDRGTRRD